MRTSGASAKGIIHGSIRQKMNIVTPSPVSTRSEERYS